MSRRMKKAASTSRIHPIDFFAIFPSEREAARQRASFAANPQGQVVARDDGSWNLQVSRVMYATHAAIGASNTTWRSRIAAGRRAGRVGHDPGGHFAASVMAADPGRDPGPGLLRRAFLPRRLSSDWGRSGHSGAIF